MKVLETRSTLVVQEHVHIIHFLSAKDKVARLTLQLGPGDTSIWTGLSDPSNPRMWSGFCGDGRDDQSEAGAQRGGK